TKVAYKLLDPEQFRNMKILVVGGGDSAIEAALTLSEEDGTEVSLSYRKPMFSRIKEKNQQRIDQAIEQGRVRTYFESQAKEITPTEVVLSHGDKELTLPNDFVFVLIGGEAPSRFLKSVGIEMVMKHGQR
ncbi:MAG: NAD(P)-binding domain-containing protein, partial [Candidatus Zixiibacteriota bacterium]